MNVLASASLLPEPFLRWFAGRGWTVRAHQLDLLATARAGRSVLLIAPTGAGKTLAGFLPSLIELSAQSSGQGGLHTLYISPLKALAVDIARNLERPVAEMRLPIRIETRTGDTPASKRQRQRRYPPQILLTPPAHHALGEMYELIKRKRTTLVFVNTRSQAESIFQGLWRINDDGLAIALHHGSLDVAQRRKVEAAMAEGRLRAVVCTSSLDLGVDWGDVDLVINVGAPKGASRLLQRIGRANHRMDDPSRGVLVPANRFEVLECRAAPDAVAANAQDPPAARSGALDVLAQHVLGSACGEPFLADNLYNEVVAAAPYANLTRADFDDALEFVATGGYALTASERFAKIRRGQDGRWRVSHPMIAQRYRMNVGTTVEAGQ